MPNVQLMIARLGMGRIQFECCGVDSALAGNGRRGGAGNGFASICENEVVGAGQATDGEEDGERDKAPWQLADDGVTARRAAHDRCLAKIEGRREPVDRRGRARRAIPRPAGQCAEKREAGTTCRPAASRRSATERLDSLEAGGARGHVVDRVSAGDNVKVARGDLGQNRVVRATASRRIGERCRDHLSEGVHDLAFVGIRQARLWVSRPSHFNVLPVRSGVVPGRS